MERRAVGLHRQVEKDTNGGDFRNFPDVHTHALAKANYSGLSTNDVNTMKTNCKNVAVTMDVESPYNKLFEIQ